MSTRKGGRADHHGSHQSGRDVDLLFYLTDTRGNPVANTAFVPIDKNGYSTDPPMKFRFDTRRNWALAEALATSGKADVQWIFVSDDIRNILLAYAAENGVSDSVLRKVEKLFKQPGAKTHVDHFHVRVYCPLEDRPACVDTGPLWARSE
jgi:penicillin-insensitive murein DD-endopeptidase